tara:strand:+ start:1982 stop:2290 length:309 start_codon:yes stop_codon:yes gene_type:complete
MMPRFEIYLMFAEKDELTVETSEYKMVCWVKDPSNMVEVQKTANEVIEDHIEDAEKEVLFGTASVMIEGSEVLNIGFRNKDADPDDISEVIELFGIREETRH